MNKVAAINSMIEIALDEVVDHNGLPQDENEKVSCKDFLSLVHQYARSMANKTEVKNALNNALSHKIEKYENKTLKEVLVEYIKEDQIIKKPIKKNKP